MLFVLQRGTSKLPFAASASLIGEKGIVALKGMTPRGSR